MCTLPSWGPVSLPEQKSDFPLCAMWGGIFLLQRHCPLAYFRCLFSQDEYHPFWVCQDVLWYCFSGVRYLQTAKSLFACGSYMTYPGCSLLPITWTCHLIGFDSCLHMYPPPFVRPGCLNVAFLHPLLFSKHRFLSFELQFLCQGWRFYRLFFE